MTKVKKNPYGIKTPTSVDEFRENLRKYYLTIPNPTKGVDYGKIRNLPMGRNDYPIDCYSVNVKETGGLSSGTCVAFASDCALRNSRAYFIDLAKGRIFLRIEWYIGAILAHHFKCNLSSPCWNCSRHDARYRGSPSDCMNAGAVAARRTRRISTSSL